FFRSLARSSPVSPITPAAASARARPSEISSSIAPTSWSYFWLPFALREANPTTAAARARTIPPTNQIGRPVLFLSSDTAVSLLSEPAGGCCHDPADADPSPPVPRRGGADAPRDTPKRPVGVPGYQDRPECSTVLIGCRRARTPERSLRQPSSFLPLRPLLPLRAAPASPAAAGGESSRSAEVEARHRADHGHRGRPDPGVDG